MLNIFSPFSWRGTLRRRPYFLRSIPATALFLLGFFLILSLNAASLPGEPVSVLAAALAVICATVSSFATPLAALGSVFLYGISQMEQSFMNELNSLLPPADSGGYTLCLAAAILLMLTGSLWLLALTVRRLRDAGISRWNLLELISYGVILMLFPAAASQFQQELLGQISLGVWLGVLFLIQCVWLLRRSRQQDSDA